MQQYEDWKYEKGSLRPGGDCLLPSLGSKERGKEGSGGEEGAADGKGHFLARASSTYARCMLAARLLPWLAVPQGSVSAS